MLRAHSGPLLLVVCLAVIASGCARTVATMGRGERIEVLAAWTGAEERSFGRVLADFEARSGVSVTYSAAGTAGVPAALDQLAAAGHVPDVAFLPQPGALRAFAARGLLLPLDAGTAALVASSYNSAWRRLGSYRDRVYGVWFKAADKSLIWYNVDAFEHRGVVPPTDFDGLLLLARAFSASGLPAFALGGSDRWTLTDWFENLYLRVAGPAMYNRLADHRLAWTDPTVKTVLRLMSEVLAPDLLAGGVAGALRTSFPTSVDEVFGDPPGAAMTSEGDFVAGPLRADTHAVLGVDADVFPFPAVGAAGPGVVGGGDVAVLLHRSPAASAFLRYLALPAAATPWASRGGFISPNNDVDLSIYPDAVTRSVARSLLDAGDSFCFDLSDQQPPAFGSTPSAGMQDELAAFLADRDVDGTATRLETEARAAYGR